MASQQVQKETEKLKELYQLSSKVLIEWPHTDLISFCIERDFVVLIKKLSELDLEAAVYVLKRQLDIEVQLVRCLDYLRKINSDCKDIATKFIESQRRVAMLRSRLLLCVNKQLNELYGNEGFRLPWHDGYKDDRRCSSEIYSDSSNKSDEGILKSTKEPSLFLHDLSSEPRTDLENTIKLVASTDETEHSLAGVKTHKVGESDGRDKIQILQETLQKNLHEKGHDSKSVSVAPPPKPAPYSPLQKMSNIEQTSSADSSKELMSSNNDENDGVVIEEQIHMQDWDPILLLQDLFGECDKEHLHVQAQTEEPSASSIVRMSGYMEKLPSSYKQKKSSVFKGWRKRHFKAFDGKLFYFEDHRNNEPLGMVNLTGTSAVISAGKILELTDSEGKAILKLRCATPVEAEDWKHAIDIEAINQQKSVSEEIHSYEEGSVIIIDLGSSAVKAGFAKEEAWPQAIFPCVCAVLKDDESNCLYGFDAFEPQRRKISHLRFPLRRSLKIDKLKFSPSDLTGVLEHTFSSLNVDPSKYKVVMTLPQNTSFNDKAALVEILLGYFNVQACYLEEQAILAMYSYSAVSGVIVDIGDHIDVIPVVEGCVIEAGASRLPYGGRQVTDLLARLLTEKGHRFFSEVESYITRYIKEQCCYVSKKEICDEQENLSSTDVLLDKYMIPGGTRKVTLDTARYRCAEGLFNPMVLGRDHPGISDLVYKAIMACSMDVRKQMSRSIYLSGGGSMLPGFPERLQTDVCSLLPPHAVVQVHAGTDRHHAAFIGASVVARLPLFEELCITQEEWNDNGNRALEKWQNL